MDARSGWIGPVPRGPRDGGTRVADPTDVLLGTLGAVGGMVIAARLVCSAGGEVDAAEYP